MRMAEAQEIMPSCMPEAHMNLLLDSCLLTFYWPKQTQSPAQSHLAKQYNLPGEGDGSEDLNNNPIYHKVCPISF